MLTLSDVCKFLDGIFTEYQCADFSNNGLQVEASGEITKVAFAVDASLETMTRAAEEKSELLVVHHGISWGGGLKRVTGIDARRMAVMFKNGVSLYACHLPLDAHEEYGNNAVIAKTLGLENTRRFYHACGMNIGICGEFSKGIMLEELEGRIIDTVSPETIVVDNTNGSVRRVGIVSGSGASAVGACREMGLDCLITGEFEHQYFSEARESGISVIAAGHYFTEAGGVNSLMELVAEKFGAGTVFIQAPTGF